MPMSLVALPHSTGNTVPDAMPVGERVRELGGVDLLVGEVALHEVVVADDDALDERVVHRVLLGLHLGGDRALGALRRAVGVGARRCRSSRSMTPRKLGLLADRQLRAARRRRRTWSFSWSSVRANDARSRSSLFTKIARGSPSSLGHAPRDLGLHLDALDRGHDEQREVGGLAARRRRRRRSRRSRACRAR